MAILSSREDFMNAINTFIGDRNDDDALTFISNMADTYDSMGQTVDVNAINNEWQSKYNALDNDWRNKYKDRFMGKVTQEKIDDFEDKEPDNANPYDIKNFDDLFKKG